MDRQHEKPLLKGSPYGGEGGCRYLLEDGHDEAQGAPFVTLLLGQIVSVSEVLQQGVVKLAFGLRERKTFGVHYPAGK
jgi:hypothetical protein